ncbi:hypothetical protein [Deinococcus sp.]|uniref:hypothetical protein n=1 Tax=Deinococcus sp. TaxID=47478 RepID=UPI003B5A01AE
MLFLWQTDRFFTHSRMLEAMTGVETQTPSPTPDAAPTTPQPKRRKKAAVTLEAFPAAPAPERASLPSSPTPDNSAPASKPKSARKAARLRFASGPDTNDWFSLGLLILVVISAIGVQSWRGESAVQPLPPTISKPVPPP